MAHTAGWPAKKNSAFRLQFPLYDADGDLVTGATCDTELSADGGTFADASSEAAEIATSSGCYWIELTAGEMNYDRVMAITKSGTAKTAVNMIYTSTRNIDDLAYPATSGRSIQVETDGMIHADVKEWLTAAPNALQTGRVDSYTGAMATDVVTAGAIQADAITSSELATTAVNEIRDAILADSTPFNGANIDAAVSTRATPAQVNTEVDTALSDIDLDHFIQVTAGAEEPTDGSYLDQIMHKDVSQTFDATTDSLEALRDNQANLATAANLQTVDDNVDAILLDTGTDGVVIADGGITAAKIATDAITSDELATSAADKIADEVWDEPTTGHVTGGTFGEQAKTDIDAILDDTGTAGVQVADKSGYALSAAGVDAIWDEAISGHISSGTFGEAINFILDATVSATGAVSDAGASATDFDTDLTEASDNHYDGHTLVFRTGNLAGQGRMIQNYTGASKNCAFDRAFSEAPANTDTFVIIANPSSAWDMLLARLADVEGEAVVGSARVAVDAFALLRNKVDASTSTMTVYKTNDTTSQWTSSLTTDSGADPITVTDPA